MVVDSRRAPRSSMEIVERRLFSFPGPKSSDEILRGNQRIDCPRMFPRAAREVK